MRKKSEQGQRHSSLRAPSDLGKEASRGFSAGLNVLLTDMFALYLRTKNFHWHVSGPHFDMLSELRDDNLQLAAHLREPHGICEEHGDVRPTHPNTELFSLVVSLSHRRFVHTASARRRISSKSASN